MGKLKSLTKETLQELYVVQNKTDKEIGALYGVTDVAVNKRRLRLGIPTKSQLSRVHHNDDLSLEFEQLTPVRLAEIYSAMGQRAIAKRYGVSKPTVMNKLQKFGIRPISKTERSTSYQDLTEEQKEICIGTLLGDGHLLERGVLKVSHYYGQFEYLLHLHKVLSPLSLPLSYSEKDMDNGQLTFEFSFRTIQHSWLKSLRSIFYPDEERIYPTSILQSLTPRSLAYWYFDDGMMDDGLPTLCVGKITDVQFQNLETELERRFSFDLYERTSGGTCRLLKFRASSTAAFFNLIKDFATPDLLYKFPPKYWPKGALPRLPTKTEQILLPESLSNEAKHWSSLNENDQAGVVELFTDYWTKTGFPLHVPRPEELEVLFRIEPQHIIQDGKIKIRQVGQSICQGLCSSIWSAYSHGSKSPVEIFSDKNLLREAISFCLKMGGIPNQSQMRATFRYWRKGGVYNFRPSAAKVLVDRYCPKNGVVLDPCAGYGGRLLGTAMSSAGAKYVGYEPATKTFIGLKQLHTWLCQYLPDLKDRIALINQPAEDASFPECDMVLTSPPYWKREVYSSEDTQSSIRFPIYEMWLENFWAKIIKNCVASLRSGGWLILNVDDFNFNGKLYSLVNDTIHIGDSLGLSPPEILIYLVPGGSATEPQSETVLCWVKNQKSEFSALSTFVSETSLTLPRCSYCGKTKPIEELLEGECLICRTSSLKICFGCGVEFRPKRKDHLFHDEACYARHKRKLYRQEHPASGVRIFTCTRCEKEFETSAFGSFKFCPSCRDEKEVENRKKVCAYRHCSQPFVDTSTQNSMKFCCPEHRRREKLFRSGLAQDLSYFRDSKEVGWRTCHTCGEKFFRGEEETFIRCPSCRDKARVKTCFSCGITYKDTSDLNTRRYCYRCSPEKEIS